MSGGGSDVGKDAAQAQSNTSRELMDMTRPGRDAFLKNVLAAMKGKPGEIPLIRSAMQGSEYGRTRALEDTAKLSGKLGFSAPQQRAITEPLSTKGKQGTSDVREALLRQFRAYGPGLMIQPAQIAQAGLAPAVQRGQANAAAKKAADNQAAASGGAAAAAITSALIIAAASYSRAAMKERIEDVSALATEIIGDIACELPLRTYAYKDDPAHLRLGLVIEDLEAHQVPFLITSDGNHVDLYSLATMAIAAVQTQQRTIAALEARLAALENTHGEH